MGETKMFHGNKKLIILIACVAIAFGGYWLFGGSKGNKVETAKEANTKSPESITISAQQAQSVAIAPVKTQQFVSHRGAVGYVDFNQDKLVQVFSPYTGRIRQVFVQNGDDVRKGQPLYSIDSPDLVQGIQNLISAAGARTLASRNLDRARKMAQIQASSQRDLDQATADHQTAEANYAAARDALRIYGKTDAEMDKIVSSRKVDGELVIASPSAGRVVNRVAAPGMLTQPGSSQPPITVADISTMWLIANVVEQDIPKLAVGQNIAVSITAMPQEKFSGRITHIASSIDPATRRITVRSEMPNDRQLLRAQMLASYTIQTGEPTRSLAVPVNGVVREGNGTMTIFSTTDGLTFTRRVVKTGLEQDGFMQILEGVSEGEKVAGDGALFLSNALALLAR